MQLKKQNRKKKQSRSVSQALTQASALLVGASAPFTHAHAENHDWQISTGVLYYSEDNNRVQAVEPAVHLRKNFGHKHILNLGLVLDSLTGASPNGAAPASIAQTFTSPSGDDTYVVDAGQLPLYEEFKDTRVSVTAGWQQPIAEDLRVNVGGHFSKEYDFQSISLNAALAKSLNNDNTTLSAGIAAEFDTIEPEGGAPKPLSAMMPPASAREGSSESKTVYDLLLGVTQVLNRRAILQVNYSLSISNGYQNDPYKLLTVIDGNGNLVENPLSTANDKLYLFESRPDSRTEHSLYAELKYHLTRDVIDVAYRFTTGDWGITTHTVDFKYRWDLGGHFYLQPHFRWYTQTEADFYRPYLRLGRDVAVGSNSVTQKIEYASPDPRLAALDAITYGAKIGYEFGRDSELSFRVEQYQQTANAPSAPDQGPLAGQTIQPDLSAIIVQVVYSFRW